MAIPLQRGSAEPTRALVEPATGDAGPWPAVGGRAALLLAAVTGVLVLLLGSAALQLRPEGSSAAAWWPATGIAVAALALVTPQRRPVVLAAIALGALGANLVTDRPPLVVVGFTLANTLAPWLWLRVMMRGGRGRPQLLTTEDFGRFVLATFAATGVAGIVGALTAQAAGTGGLLTTWATFVAAQAASILILAPLALPLPQPLRAVNKLEASLQLAALLVTILLVFVPEPALPLSVLPLPVLIWAAVRLPARWVSAELLVTGALTWVLTTVGTGPYAAVTQEGFPPELVGLLLEVAILVYVLVTLPLALTVHRQVAALASARDSFELVQSVLAGATGTAIIGFNRNGTITVFNTGAEEMLGHRADEVVGRCTPEPFHLREELIARASELGVAPGWEVLTAALERGAASERRDWTMVRNDGSHLIVSLRVTPRRSATGELLGYLAVGEDVTDRRRTESALRDALDRESQALERLAQLDAAKTLFVSSVSHELRTPMTSVLGYTDMVLDEAGGPVTQEQRGMLEAARRNGRRLLRLIEDLLTVSMIEDGRFAIELEPVDLRIAAEGAVEAVRPMTVGRRLRIEVEACDQELLVDGDLDHLERVAINLLTNAVKFTPDGGHVTLRLREDAGSAVLEVIDTGIGIPEEEQPQLFERFFRTSTAQALEIPGTGLGLSIVQAIVARHDGHIEVRSRAGVGTTFEVAIPLRQPVRR